MAADDRMTLDFILQFMDVLERHGYHHHDNQHTGRAAGLLSDVAHIYQGTQEAPAGTYLPGPPPSPQPEPGPSRPQAGRDGVTVSATQAGIIAAALDEAAGCKRDRAATCADCTDRSCGTCQWRHRAAGTYGHLATQMIRAAEASGRQPTPGTAYPARSQPRKAAGKEAGQ